MGAAFQMLFGGSRLGPGSLAENKPLQVRQSRTGMFLAHVVSQH
jgi:hypothetical protein